MGPTQETKDRLSAIMKAKWAQRRLEQGAVTNMDKINPDMNDVLKAINQPRPLTELEQIELELKRAQLEAFQRNTKTTAAEQATASQAERAKQAAKKASQLRCNHHRQDGSCRAVLTDDGTNHPYILCQKCLASIYPDTGAVHRDAVHIYDDKLFYALLQECETNAPAD